MTAAGFRTSSIGKQAGVSKSLPLTALVTPATWTPRIPHPLFQKHCLCQPGLQGSLLQCSFPHTAAVEAQLLKKKRLQVLCNKYKVLNGVAHDVLHGSGAMATISIGFSFNVDGDDDDDIKTVYPWTYWPCHQSLKIQRSKFLSPSTRHLILSCTVNTGQILLVIAGGKRSGSHLLL